MRKSLLLLILLVLLSSLAWSGVPQDQMEDTLRIEITKSNLRIPIAIPSFSAEGGSEYSQIAQEITEIVRNDLKNIAIFNLADEAVYSRVGYHNHNNIPFDLYTQFKIDAVALGQIFPDEKGIKVHSRLFSVRDKSSLFGKSIVGKKSQVRYLAHTISSHILYHFTGATGIFKSRITYSSNHELSDPANNSEIWVMDWDGAQQRRITYSNSLKKFPTFGPGDTGIVYTSFINNNADVYHLSLTGGTAEKIFASRQADMAPAISPDGKLVAFCSSFNKNNMDIYVSDLDGNNLRRLTTNRNIDSSPCWSPDGRRIAFTSGRTGTVQIYTMNADGSNQQRITFEGRYNDGADWSPDGRYIAYSSRRSGSKTFDIKIHDLTTNQTYYVTRDVENDENPSFSPDGKSIAFASDRSGKYQIYTINIDGTGMTALTSQGENKHPSWSDQ